MIDITGIDPVKFVQKVYELSIPQGMGFLHYTTSLLSEEESFDIVQHTQSSNIVLSMDYIRGRACKMNVFNEKGKWMIHDSWYDHTDSQLKKLLSAFNIKVTGSKEHGCACNCGDCQLKPRSERV